jgi:ankyrin repeat protein
MTPTDDITHAFATDDAQRVRTILEAHPELKGLIEAPIGPFDSPAIVRVRSREMLDVLLDAGANINARSRWWAGGFGLLDCASPELAAYAIKRGATVDANAAARLGMLERLRAMVASQPSVVHARGGDGQTPLHVASTIAVAAFLLDNGADINARDVDHESTPAQYMVRERQDVARYLVSRGCQTDILMAAALGDLALTRRHLDADPASVRTRVNSAFFPMSNPRAGGTIYQWTLGFYVTAHHVAREFGHGDVLALLLERSPADVRLIDACWTGDEAGARSIARAHPDIAANLAADDRRQVADAARNNDLEAVRVFLESGWPADARGQHQATPLHWAAFNGNVDMAESVLKAGAPLEATDADYGGTPLGWAIFGSEHGGNAAGNYSATVELLLRAGATPPADVSGSPAVQDVLRRHSHR